MAIGGEIQRNRTIDELKGLLILTVVLGHFLLGSFEDNPVKFVIYTFHMQVFFFLSGYLINLDKLATLKPYNFINHYWKRMLAIWCVAWLSYSLLNYPVNLDKVHALLKLIIYPYYHLWYVPTLFGLLVLTYLLRKCVQNKVVVIILIVLGCAFLPIILKSGHWLFTFSYLLYFAIGVLFRNMLINRKLPKIGGGYFLLFLLLSVAVWFLMNRYEALSFPFCRFIVMLPFVVILLIVCANLIKRDSLRKSIALQTLGRNSLGIYLWHVLFIDTLKTILQDNVYLYYIVCFSIFVLLIIVSGYWGRKNRLLFSSEVINN